MGVGGGRGGGVTMLGSKMTSLAILRHMVVVIF